MEDALRIQEAGADALVLECIPAPVGTLISELLEIPVIGIGAGNGCDGQVLVYQDMLGLFSDFVPKFAKQFADAGAVIREGVTQYIAETKSGAFPAKEHTFSIAPEELEQLRAAYHKEANK